MKPSSLLPFVIVTFALAACGHFDPSASAHADTLQVLSAYYMPDAMPPANSHQVEGVRKPSNFGMIWKPLQQLYVDYADFGALRIVVRNNDNHPVEIGPMVLLNGRRVESHYVDFLKSDWDARGVNWYRVRPKKIDPGQCGQIYIRFRKRLQGSAVHVAIHGQNGLQAETTIPFQGPKLQVEYVIADRSQQTLYIYARRNGGEIGNLTAVKLDGVPLTNVKFYGAEFPGDVALAVAKLSKPLQIGDFHVAGVETDRGAAVAAQFRVLPFFFLRTSWNWYPKSPQVVRDLHMNAVFDKPGTYTAEKARQLNIYTMMSVHDDYGRHDRSRYEYFTDEPDAKDLAPGSHELYGKPNMQHPQYTGRVWAIGLGRTAREMTESGRFEKLEREIPHAASYHITNGTTRPLNWAVYGQFTDIACTDPYPCNYYGADLATIREQYTLLWKASRPNIMYACVEAYGGRFPSPQEYRQMGVQALGCGMKGITSWVAHNGWERYPALQQEVADFNAMLEHIEDELMLGVPAAIVTNDSGTTVTGSWFHLDGPYKLDKPWMKERVWTSALICGPDAIVIAAANHIPASQEEPKHIEPARNVKVSVQLPGYLRSVKCFEVMPDGERSVPIKVSGDKAVLKLDTIRTGRVFILRGD